MPFTDGPALKFEPVTRAPANCVTIDVVDRPEHESAVPVAMSMADQLGRTRTARPSRFPALASCKTFSCKTFETGA
jgi:hypothetical protein